MVLTSGQKIQLESTAALSVERPNKLRAERRGDLVYVYYNCGPGVYYRAAFQGANLVYVSSQP